VQGQDACHLRVEVGPRVLHQTLNELRSRSHGFGPGRVTNSQRIYTSGEFAREAAGVVPPSGMMASRTVEPLPFSEAFDPLAARKE